MTECKNCGEHVSERYAKVFGDNNDEVHACPSCQLSRGMDRRRAGL